MDTIVCDGEEIKVSEVEQIGGERHLIWKEPEFVENRVGVTVTDDPISG
jgi:hypothetical protein